MQTREIVDYLVDRVSAVSVDSEPYQNFYQTGIFPPDLYAQIRARIPQRTAYQPLNIKRWKNARGASTRDKLVLSGDDIDRINSEDRGFWEMVTEALMSREFQVSVFSKLRDDVALRLSCSTDEVVSQRVVPTVMLVRDYEDYQLKPHPDGHPRVVTMMFYLPDEGASEDLGTSVYRERSMFSRFTGRRFEEVKRFPYRPNSTAAFAVNDSEYRRSWHGRELIEEVNVIRDSLIVAWLYEEQSDFGRRHNQ